MRAGTRLPVRHCAISARSSANSALMCASIDGDDLAGFADRFRDRSGGDGATIARRIGARVPRGECARQLLAVAEKALSKTDGEKLRCVRAYGFDDSLRRVEVSLDVGPRVGNTERLLDAGVALEQQLGASRDREQVLLAQLHLQPADAPVGSDHGGGRQLRRHCLAKRAGEALEIGAQRFDRGRVELGVPQRCERVVDRAHETNLTGVHSYSGVGAKPTETGVRAC